MSAATCRAKDLHANLNNAKDATVAVKEAKQNDTVNNNESEVGFDFVHAGVLLLFSNLMVASMMAVVYLLGKDNPLTNLFIYGPITGILIVLVRDKYAFLYTVSSLLAIAHGVAHVLYPFLDESSGVNHEVEVWQDQVVHLFQAVLFSVIFFNQNSVLFTAYSLALMTGNVVNVALGYTCWGKSCHNLYVWVSLLPSLSSGLHFATGAFFLAPKNVGKYGFAIQATSSVCTYFLFKASDDILKLFALCRFFEIYFIAPHYLGYFYGRYTITKETPGYENMPMLEVILKILGIYANDMEESNKSLFFDYFDSRPKDAKKAKLN